MEENIDALLETLNKKDDDIEILNVDNGGVTFTTTNSDVIDNFNEVYSLDIEDAPLVDAYIDVTSRVLQVIFSVNAALGYVIVVLGFIPYCIFQLIPATWRLYALGGSAGCFVLTYFAMVVFSRLVFVLMWFFTTMIFAGVLAAYIENILPLQFGALIFTQSVAVMIYVALKRKNLNNIVMVIVDIVGGLVPLLVGIYAFIEEKDWLVAWIALVYVLLSPLYHYFQMKKAKRFSLDNKQLSEAVRHFYGDIFLFCKK